MFCPTCGKKHCYDKFCDCGTIVYKPYCAISGWMTKVGYRNKPLDIKPEPLPDISYFIKEADKKDV